MPICAETIRHLCSQVLAAQNEIALNKALSELQAALQEYSRDTNEAAPTLRPDDHAA